MFKNAVIVMMVLGTLAVASCSGGAGAPLDEMTPDTQNTQSVNQAAQDDEQLSSIQWQAVTDKPVLPRDASDWGDFFQDIDPDWPDWGDIFNNLHHSVVSGENNVPLDGYMGSGGDADYSQTIVGFDWNGFFPEPVFGYALTLNSTADAPAFATFGFKDFPAGERLTSIHAEGLGGDLWIGVAGFGNKDAYRWFGPHDLNEGPVELELPFMDSTNDSNRGYVTLLTHGGDSATIDNLVVTVGEQTLVPDIDFDFDIDIIPDWDL